MTFLHVQINFLTTEAGQAHRFFDAEVGAASEVNQRDDLSSAASGLAFHTWSLSGAFRNMRSQPRKFSRS